MSFNEVMDAIIMLARSQGFYGRLCNAIDELAENDYETFVRFQEEIEAQKFKDIVDMVLYFEC